MDGRISQENLRIVALKLIEFTRFASPSQSIYFNFVRCWGSVVMLKFLNKLSAHSPFIEKSIIIHIKQWQ